MSANGINTTEDADMTECDGEKVVTMMDVLQEQEEFEEDANAVLGASDDKNCTYPKGYIKRQAIYACLTCCVEARDDTTKRAGVCLACSLMCHENHELVELYTKRNFRCDCGNPKFNSHPCQFTSDKTELNDDNKYNQNFSGLYCICHRPYPDPESIVEDEMIQCIICEDWLHSSHLDATVPTNEQYAEMICKGCMDKNEFIHDYSEFAVNCESNDVDNMTINKTEITVINTTGANGTLEQTLTNGITSKEESKEEMHVDTPEKDEDVTNVEDNCNDLNNKSCMNESKSFNTPENTDVSNENIMDTDETERKLTSDVKDNDKSDEITTEPNDKKAGTNITESETNNSILLSESDGKRSDITNNVKTSCEENSIDTDSSKETSELVSETEQNNISLQPNIQQNNTTENTEESGSNNSNENSVKDNGENGENSAELKSIETDIEKGQASNNDTNEGRNIECSQSTATENDDIIRDLDDKIKESSSTESGIESKSTEKQIEALATETASAPSGTGAETQSTECETNPTPAKTTNESQSTESEVEAESTKTTNESNPIESEVEAESTKTTNESQSTESEVEAESTKTTNESNPTESEVEAESTKTTNESNPTESEVEPVLTKSTNESQPTLSKSEALETETHSTPQGTTDQSSDKNENDKIEDSEVIPNVLENKRKLSTEQSETDEIVTKKAKLDYSKQCIRPKGIKRRFKGATFWPSNFRQQLCTCNECLSMYKDLSVLFLIDPEDTVTAYETLGKEKINGAPASQYEKGLLALSSLDRVQQINALTEYNKMRDKLLDFLKSFKDRKEIVKEEDIKAFFAGMKPKREPDGVYFCR